MLSEILGERGWNTYMVGKWHLCPTDEMNLASTRRNWPSGRGFERWYGFLGAETNQWYPGPGLRQPPGRPAASSPAEGYHLTDDITDKAHRVHQGRQGGRAGQAVLPLLRARRLPRAAPRLQGVGRQVQGPVRHGLRGDARADAGPAEGDGHRPGRHRAAADQPDRHARDPQGARGPALPAARRHPAVGLAVATRRSACSRGWPRSTRASWPTPTTTSAACSTTWRSPGSARTRWSSWSPTTAPAARAARTARSTRCMFANGIPDDIQAEPGDARRARRDEDLQPLSRTAGRWPSTRRSRCGSGTSSTAAPPTRASSPGRPARRARGELRHQYHHAIDIVPTILDVLGVEPPATDQGARAEPLRRREHALQLRRRVGAVGARKTQFYSMLGSRGIWHDGWKAVTTHPTISGWSNFNDDTWELYHTDIDRAELHDLAAEHPDKLRELVNLWFAEAGRATTPSRSTTGRRWRSSSRRGRSWPRRANRYVYFPGTAEVPEAQAVNIRNRSFAIGALVDIPAPGAQGVLFAHGSRFGGHALYVKDNRLHYVNNFVGMVEQKIDGTQDIPTGREPDPVRRRSRRTARTRRTCRPGSCRSTTATRRSARAGSRPSPGMFSLAGEGLCVGRDSGEPVTERLPGRAPARVHRRHDQAGRRRRQRRALRRPGARGPGHAGARVASPGPAPLPSWRPYSPKAPGWLTGCNQLLAGGPDTGLPCTCWRYCR